MLPVFQHNAIDILSLACLAGIVPYAFKEIGRQFGQRADVRAAVAAVGFVQFFRLEVPPEGRMDLGAPEPFLDIANRSGGVQMRFNFLIASWRVL